MKKKVIFMLINMNIGGTEKALLNMIAEMPKLKYDITILMLEKYGGFLDSIPNSVRVVYVKDYLKFKKLLNQPAKVTIVDLLKKGKVFKGLNLFWVHVLAKFTNNRAIFFKYILKDVPDFKSEYDIAVAYAGPMDFISYFVIKKIHAKKKIQWIHFDVTKIGFNRKFSKKLYQNFEKIYVVSDEAKQKMVAKLPSVLGKIEVFYNIVSVNEVRNQARSGNGFSDSYSGIRILTVGRLAMEKGQDIAIKALARLKEEGYEIRWYCIGEGNARKQYERLIEQYRLQDSFILLGAKSNPYPYMDQCDIYVQPSRYEGYCITLIEAKCLCKPIITTNVNGAKEQITNEVNGLIVNIDDTHISNAIKRFIHEDRLYGKFTTELSKRRILSQKRGDADIITSIF